MCAVCDWVGWGEGVGGWIKCRRHFNAINIQAWGFTCGRRSDSKAGLIVIGVVVSCAEACVCGSRHVWGISRRCRGSWRWSNRGGYNSCGYNLICIINIINGFNINLAIRSGLISEAKLVKHLINSKQLYEAKTVSSGQSRSTCGSFF